MKQEIKIQKLNIALDRQEVLFLMDLLEIALLDLEKLSALKEAPLEWARDPNWSENALSTYKYAMGVQAKLHNAAQD